MSRRGGLGLLLCVALAGCAVRTPSPPGGAAVPAGTGGGPTPARDVVAPPEPVELTTSGGATVPSDWRPAASEARAGLLLVPEVGQASDGFAALSQALAGYNVASLAVDLSAKGEPRLAVAAGVGELRARLDDAPVVLVGVGGGANLAVARAAAVPAEVAGLVLLSPLPELGGVKITEPWAKLRAKPALVITTADDTKGIAGAKLQADHEQTAFTLLQYDSAAHGRELFAEHPQVTGRILDWVQRLP